VSDVAHEPAPEMVTLALTLAYDGAGFSGFARQQGEVRTVQAELEAALATLVGALVDTVCAGRTDAGVHAQGQVVSCDIPTSALGRADDLAHLVRSLNALTPPDIVVREARIVAEGWSARFDTVAREYRYLIANTTEPPLFTASYAWHVVSPLDLATMREAATRLVGEHDFASFCVAASADSLHEQGLSTCREIISIEIDTVCELGEPLIAVTVVGNAFLHSMVRTIVGTLVEVGRGKRPPEWVQEVLDARNRAAAGPCAPAHGLTFVRTRER